MRPDPFRHLRRAPAVRALPLVLGACALLASCQEPAPAPRATAARSCDEPGVREVVERLGGRLEQVSLLAPDSTLRREIRRAYAPFVTAELLEAWSADPARAPGRPVSSPWPERIEIRAVEAAGEGACRVTGEVVYVSSAEDARGGAAHREPVTAWVRLRDGAWRVAAYEAAAARPTAAAEPDTAGAAPADTLDPAGVIRRYYEAIAARDYRRAYALWGDGGAASGQSFEEFAGGFAETARVEAEVGAPGRVEGAAGSRYARVPVVVRATTVDGTEQRFAGSYTLRRSVVPGASVEQRRWRIHAAEMVRER